MSNHLLLEEKWLKNTPKLRDKNESSRILNIVLNRERFHENIGGRFSEDATHGLFETYFLEFDGASKGNPGLAGAGAILRANDGSTVCRLQEGVGIATCNVAEYRAIILGLKHALKNGIKHIYVQGDSKLVCMQVQGLWKLKNQNMAELCKVAKELKDKFVSFEISHVPRNRNSDADALANRAIHLQDGVVLEDCIHK
ncbi:uncharacterized protein LOC103487060 isoform X4 [Cucumis melo]|uniref:Uncharacterized protein LOC103487060 isoform X4 n=1 Tax=Cucumis melo TaxID=3656 RepID=A0ABM3KPY8_CUCME|nr:uncharacterized protein LOC103487060 isoform X4 [Cucumis melo]